ncbi:hypothetical protein PRIPAC_88220 [Pristionchus pacificus]|uniref:Uncharacterized protein n=1 Tax=Pristionchus pacificus TaxID=54126 RepID=A0A2A6CVL1_PRIPA|nr:hypothetical protein PRIPAC_88220 [Pristionchus pacificus]|eukprot:PDM82274.1 hypothetical protein PRIPAC_36667 [Pristionchus pacificus]
MVHSADPSPVKVPRGPSEHSTPPIVPLETKFINFAPRKTTRKMSQFESSYKKLLSSISSLSPLVTSIENDISQIFEISSSDEIEKISARVARILVDAQIIRDDYSDRFSSLTQAINSMDDNDSSKDVEQRKLQEFKSSSEAATSMEVDPVSVANVVSKLENKFRRSLETATVRAMWKANTRLANASLISETKSPVFIPTSTDSILAKLIISDIHHSSSHASVDVILNQVKRKYWIPRFCSRRGTPTHITSDKATTFKMASTLWKMAKILSLTNTSATLKSHAGRVIERPLNLLIPLEIHSNENTTQLPVPVDEPEPINTHPMTTRSKKMPIPTTVVAKPKKPKILFDHDRVVKDITNSVEKKMKKIVLNVVTEGVGLLKEHFDSLVSQLSMSVDSLSDVVSTNLVDPTPIVVHATDVNPSTTRPPHVTTPVVVQSNQITPSNPRYFPNRAHLNRPLSTSTQHRQPNRNPIPAQSHKSHSRSRSPISRNQSHHPQCVFCKSTRHFTRNCDVVTSLHTRLSITHSSNRCTKCFRILNASHRVDCEPNLCTNGCVTPQGGPERHCYWFCPANPALMP